MTPLREVLEEQGLVSDDVLSAALLRQQIYGGALDTVLLETEALEPAQIDRLLSEACGLPSAPTTWIHPARDRPSLPDAWAGTAFALLRTENGVAIAFGPDVDDETLLRLRHDVPDAIPLVTPACCVALLAAERAGTVVPQRLGTLALDFVRAVASTQIEDRAGEPADPPGPADPLPPPPAPGGGIPGLPTPGTTGGSSIMQRALALLDQGVQPDDPGPGSGPSGLPPPPPSMDADPELQPNTLMGVPMENLGLDELLDKQPRRKSEIPAEPAPDAPDTVPAPAPEPVPGRSTDPAPPLAADPTEILIDALAAGGGNLAALRDAGEAGLARLAARLPGPLTVGEWELDSVPPPSHHGPLLRATVELGSVMTHHVVPLLVDAAQRRRFYGALLFQELRDATCMPELARLAFDPAPEVRAVATRVLETYSREPAMGVALAGLREHLSTPDPEACVHAARALGTLRDPDAVPDLIPLLGHAERIVRLAALEALCSITARRGAATPEDWAAWFEQHGDRHRIEWLITSLADPDRAIRAWTEAELMRVTGKRMGATATDDTTRDEAVRAWQAWWQTEGRTVYAGASRP